MMKTFKSASLQSERKSSELPIDPEELNTYLTKKFNPAQLSDDSAKTCKKMPKSATNKSRYKQKVKVEEKPVDEKLMIIRERTQKFREQFEQCENMNNEQSTRFIVNISSDLSSHEEDSTPKNGSEKIPILKSQSWEKLRNRVQAITENFKSTQEPKLEQIGSTVKRLKSGLPQRLPMSSPPTRTSSLRKSSPRLLSVDTPHHANSIIQVSSKAPLVTLT